MRDVAVAGVSSVLEWLIRAKVAGLSDNWTRVTFGLLGIDHNAYFSLSGIKEAVLYQVDL